MVGIDEFPEFARDPNLSRRWNEFLQSWKHVPESVLKIELSRAHAWLIANPRYRRRDRFLTNWLLRAFGREVTALRGYMIALWPRAHITDEMWDIYLEIFSPYPEDFVRWALRRIRMERQTPWLPTPKELKSALYEFSAMCRQALERQGRFSRERFHAALKALISQEPQKNSDAQTATSGHPKQNEIATST